MKQKFSTKLSHALKLLAWRVGKGTNMITELKDNAGKNHTNPKDEVQVMMDYFRNLYQSTNPSPDDTDRFLEAPNIIKKLTLDHKDYMASSVTAQELILLTLRILSVMVLCAIKAV